MRGDWNDDYGVKGLVLWGPLQQGPGAAIKNVGTITPLLHSVVPEDYQFFVA